MGVMFAGGVGFQGPGFGAVGIIGVRGRIVMGGCGKSVGRGGIVKVRVMGGCGQSVGRGGIVKVRVMSG